MSIEFSRKINSDVIEAARKGQTEQGIGDREL
jgi:hypothetical protein